MTAVRGTAALLAALALLATAGARAEDAPGPARSLLTQMLPAQAQALAALRAAPAEPAAPPARAGAEPAAPPARAPADASAQATRSQATEVQASLTPQAPAAAAASTAAPPTQAPASGPAATAETPASGAAATAETPAAPAAAPRPRPRRRVVRRPPPEAEAPPAEARGPRLDPAPVPNRTLEGPRLAAPAEKPSFGPSIIHRALPNTAAARDGSRNYDEERLFFPAPGARLTVPFSY